MKGLQDVSVRRLLHSVASELPLLLGEDLVGIYLYGSLTQDAFDIETSDVDCIAVTRSDLSDAQFTEIGSWFERSMYRNLWTARLQMQFLVKEELLQMNGRACLYQFGQWKRAGSDGNPIVWINILKSGLTLYGMKPDRYLPEITRPMLHEALVRELGYLRKEIGDAGSSWRCLQKYRAYVVLTLCRIMYTHTTGEIASKPTAAQWAGDNVPDEFKDLIFAARSDEDIDLDSISSFTDLVAERLQL